MINNLNVLERSALFAKISSYCYQNLQFMQENFKEYHVQYYTHKGSDAFVLENDTDVIVVCRGTEVQQISDVKADLSISKTNALVGKIHIGFNHYVDKIWPGILSRGVNARTENKMLWLTGHSLGAAMATIMAYRFATYDLAATPAGLFTYGSPRVGNRKFVNYFNNLPFEHHRWVNDGDIVTKIPFAPFFYHCGIMHHIDSKGQVTMNYERTFNPMKLLGLTSPRGIINTIMGDVKDHSSELYKAFLGAAAS
jgi:triacylglycerol lipase